MALELYTRSLFFNAPVEKFDESMLTHFRKEKKLREIVYEGHTIYPPLSALGQVKSPQRYTFQFEKHELIGPDLVEGEIEVTIRKIKRKRIYFPHMKLNFKNEKDAQRACDSVTKNLNDNSISSETNEIGVIDFVDKDYVINLYCHKGNFIGNNYCLILSLFRN